MTHQLKTEYGKAWARSFSARALEEIAHGARLAEKELRKEAQGCGLDKLALEYRSDAVLYAELADLLSRIAQHAHVPAPRVKVEKQ